MVEFTPLIAPLFVPANRPDRFMKTATSGTDAKIVDLEDSVPVKDKHAARESLTNTLKDIPIPVFYGSMLVVQNSLNMT